METLLQTSFNEQNTQSSLANTDHNKSLSRSNSDVLLVSMPFGPLITPSIGLSLLKSNLTLHNISAKIVYFTLQFAKLIGSSRYLLVSEKSATFDLVGEWIFSSALFDSVEINAEEYIEDVLRERSPAHRNKPKSLSENFLQDILEIRAQVDDFLNQCAKEIISERPKIVAFTSIFQQQVAALSLAKRIKAKLKETFILFGGANCEGIMGAEVIRQFLFVDAVISGEGDIVFPQLVQRILKNKPCSNLQGVYTRDNIDLMFVNEQYPNAPSVMDMDSLPIPDYDDFFEQFQSINLKLKGHDKPRILVETSRGCWWGEKKHCTFCGLNGGNMTYRSKTAQRALHEISSLADKYPDCPISVVDNILDMKYFKEFVPALAKRQQKLELFYEVKANLRKEQIQLLKEAGITIIQPGIESLSTRILEIMQKGVKSLQNIQLLKWCKEFGVTPIWNLLSGFPGEPPEEYARMAKLIPFLSHLQPPQSAATIRLDRFSPNFDESEKLGFVKVEPYPSYHHIYPLAREAVANLAYFFTFEYKEPQDTQAYTQQVFEQIAAWKKAYETSDLFLVDKGTHLLIWDLRPVALKPLQVFTDIKRLLYLSCDSIQTLNQLEHLVKKHYITEVARQDIENMMQRFVAMGLIVKDRNQYLSLAIPLGNYSPSTPVLKHFQEILQSFGQESVDQIVVPNKLLNI